MNDLFLNLSVLPSWLILLAIVLIYIVFVGGLRLFLKPAWVSSLDPFNIKLVTNVGFAIIGLLFSPIVIRAFTPSYWTIVIFIGIWLCIMRLFRAPRVTNMEDCMDIDLQTCLIVCSIAISLLNVLFNMIIPGKIPLLMENGSGVRFEATENSRLLTWLNFGVAPVGAMIYAVTGSARIRKQATVAIALQVIQSILFASKGGILIIIYILLNALFIAQQRQEKERYTKLLKGLKYAGTGIILVIPLYLSVIGIGKDGNAAVTIAMRVLGGFDQLILTSQFDLLRHGSEMFHNNIVEYQLMPLFKVISSHTYTYSSIGQYVIEAATGTYIEGPYTLPNSNLILETIFTSGTAFGLVIFVLELSLFYWLRTFALRSRLTPLTFVFVTATVFDPFGLFFSGQEWFVETSLLLATVGFAYLATLVWKGLRTISSSAS